MTTATLLREYHDALDRAKTEAAIHHYGAPFVERLPAAEAVPGARMIFRAHLQRVRGKGSPAECSQVLRDALKEIGNG